MFLTSGFLISVTDPVTVLSIFQVLPFVAFLGVSHFFLNSRYLSLLTTVIVLQELGPDVNFYTLVFEESVLNGAVSCF